MLTRNKLIVDVGELVRAPGSVDRLRFSEHVEGLSTGLTRVDTDDVVHFDLTVQSIEDGIIVRGPVHGRFHASCKRCLVEISDTFSFEAAEVYRPPRDVWEEGYVVADEKIDLGYLVRDNVLIELPRDPVCREDCAGLCPRCGANLNEGDCACVDDDVDVRWGPLQDLLRDTGGS